MDRRHYKHSIEIFYSEEDEGFIAVVPGLPGCSAFGKTEEKAPEEVKVAMELWIKTAKKEGRDIPQPHGKEMFNVLYETAFSTTCAEGAGM